MLEGCDQNNATLYLLCKAVKLFILCCTGLKTHMGLCLIITESEMTLGKGQQDKRGNGTVDIQKICSGRGGHNGGVVK